jgi:hypothetical protein
MNLLLKPLIIIALTGTVGGILSHSTHDFYWDKYLSPGTDLGHNILCASIVSFITYSIYSIAIRQFLSNQRNLIQGAFCFMIVILLVLGLGLITFGITITGIMYTISTLGITNFFIPYLRDLATFFKRSLFAVIIYL